MITAGGITYLTMGDAIDPNALVGLQLDAFAGYDNGNWADYVAIAHEHPTAALLDFTVFFQNLATAGDFEPGDMPPADAPPWAQERLAAGVVRPVVYASIGGYMPTIVADLKMAGIARSSYRLLSAHYQSGVQLAGLARDQHVCGPGTCGSPIQCDGTQWTDHGNWDESLLHLDFFHLAPPAPLPPPTHYPEDNVTSYPELVRLQGGKGWLPSPVPAAKIVNVVMATENPDAVGRYDSVPTVWSAAAQAGPHSPNGAVVVEGMVADGTYGVTIWAAS